MLQILKQTKKRRSKASNFKKKLYVLIQLKCLTINTLKEFQTIQSKHEGFKAGTSEAEIQVEAEKLKLDKAIRIQEPKDLILKMQISKASKELAKLNSAWEPVDPNEDREIITSEAALEGGFLPSLSCPL